MSRQTVRTELVIVGSGPGGIAAAAAYTRHGEENHRVLMLDELPAPGGQIWRGGAPNRVAKGWLEEIDNPAILRWKGEVIDFLPRDSGVVFLKEDGTHWNIIGRDLILATGARERWIPFPGWTLPGVVGIGGIQAMLKTGFPVEGRKVVVAGSGPLMFPVSRSLKKGGARLLAIAEQASISKLAWFAAHLPAYPEKTIEAVGYLGGLWNVPQYRGTWVKCAGGQKKLQWIELTNGKKSWRIECDLLATGCHLVPSVELARLGGVELNDDRVKVNTHCLTSRPNVFAVGECTGVGGAERAIAQGLVAGSAAAMQSELANFYANGLPRWNRFVHLLDETFAPRPEMLAQVGAGTFVCRCEDVPHGKIQSMNCWREAKLQTRMGMGACQGRVCGPIAKALYNFDVDTPRPPLIPLATQDLLELYKPEKRRV